MAAAAYKITLIVALGQPNGVRKMIPLTASDVNAAFWLFPSGSSEMVLHGSQDSYIVDTILSAAGTDTTQTEIYLNGSSTGVKLLNATTLATANSRPFQQAPMRVPAGSLIRFTQLT
jgi:hypothetical protein